MSDRDLPVLENVSTHWGTQKYLLKKLSKVLVNGRNEVLVGV